MLSAGAAPWGEYDHVVIGQSEARVAVPSIADGVRSKLGGEVVTVIV